MLGILRGVFPAAQARMDPIGHRSSFPISFEPATDQNGKVLLIIPKPVRKRNFAWQSEFNSAPAALLQPLNVRSSPDLIAISCTFVKVPIIFIGQRKRYLN